MGKWRSPASFSRAGSAGERPPAGPASSPPRFLSSLKENGVRAVLNHVGSLGCVFFTDREVTDYASAKDSDTERFKAYFRFMIDNGIYIAPSQFEAMFLSSAHSDEDLAVTLDAARRFVS